jgi:two-component system, sensor histidine kinase YesM
MLVIPILMISIISNYIMSGVVSRQVENTIDNSVSILSRKLSNELRKHEEVAHSLLSDGTLLALSQSPLDTTDAFFYFGELIRKMQFLTLSNDLSSIIRVFLLNKNRVISSESHFLSMEKYYPQDTVQRLRQSVSGWGFRRSISWFGAPSVDVLSITRSESTGNIFVSIEIPKSDLLQLLSRLAQNSHEAIFLSDGKTIAATNLPDAFERKMISASTNAVDLKSPRGYVGTMQRITGSDMNLGWYSSETVLLRPIWMVQILLAGVFISSIVASAVFAAVARKNLLIPMNNLYAAMDEVKSGNLKARVREDNTEDFGFINRQFNRMANQIETLVREVGVEHVKYQQAQLKYLQSQMDPHFLSNSLYFAYQLCESGKNADAGKLLLSLGNYLKYAAIIGNALVTLEEELTNIRHYVAIHEIRFRGRIILEEEIDESLLGLEIPRLTLQPLVENCFKHGFDTVQDNHTIWLTAKRKDGSAVLTVSDDGSGITPAHARMINTRLEQSDLCSEHAGLHNTHWRIRLRFGGDYGLKISARKPSGLSVSMTIPEGVRAQCICS